MPRAFEVEVGGNEHECCGEQIELDSVVRLRARRRGDPPVLSEVRHPAERDWDMVVVAGRVTGIEALVGSDGRRVPITRLPSGRALRGFDPVDDGLLLSAIDEEPLTERADHFLVTVLGNCVPDPPPDRSSGAPATG